MRGAIAALTALAALSGSAIASAEPAAPPAPPPPATAPGATPPAGAPGVAPGQPQGQPQPGQPQPPPPGARPPAPPLPPGASPPGAPGAAGAPPPPAGWSGYAPPPYGAPPYGAPPYGAPPGTPGAPPPGYYAQPYYYYPPPVNVLPPATLPYEDGEAVPQGYQVKTRPVRSMVIAGSVTFGATYLVSILTAATLLAADPHDSSSKQTAPLFAPVVGPFITIGTTKANGAGSLWLVLDGLAQTAGATMLIYGFAANEKYLQRTPQTAGEILSHPSVLVGAGSTAVRWRF